MHLPRRYRNTFDPRTFDAALVKRVAEAKETAQQFASDLAEKKIDPSDPNFHQGAYELAPKEPEVAVLAITGEPLSDVSLAGQLFAALILQQDYSFHSKQNQSRLHWRFHVM